MPIWRRFLVPTLVCVVGYVVLSSDLYAQTPSLKRELRSLENKIKNLEGTSNFETSASRNGEWIGRLTVDDASINICTLEIDKIKANVAREIMTLNFENEGKPKELELPLDAKSSFSEWLTLTLTIQERNRFLDRSFNFKGSISGNIMSGSFYADVTQVGDSCSGDIYFVKKGTLEAKAFLENRDPRVVRLEYRLMQLQKNNRTGLKNKPIDQNENLEKAVAELMRFRQLQKAERARLTKLKLASKAQAKELAELKKVRQDAVKAQQKQQADLASKQRKMKQAVRLRIKNDFGSYHALIIGIDGYKNLPRLKTAIADAKSVAAILKRDYGFKVTTLLNPSRENSLDKIDDFRGKLTFDDNLLIYYSGHGQLDRAADEGYWLPVNAKADRRSRWLSNNTLSSALRAFKAKHVMVVADSCYSGRLTRGISVRPRSSYNLELLKKLARKKARVVLTSGGLSPVDDDNGSGHSPFADALLKALKENSGIFDGTSLFKSVHRPVQLDTRNQEPQYSDLRRAGHDGGDFIFVKESAYAK